MPICRTRPPKLNCPPEGDTQSRAERYYRRLALTEAALKGLGLAYLAEGQLQQYVSRGRLVRVPSDWCPPFSGTTSTTLAGANLSPAFSLLVDALRYRGK
jgi:DNA-binding transcriptional LysR family regulator